MQEWEFRFIQAKWVPVGQKKKDGATVIEGRFEGADAIEAAGREGWELVSVEPFSGRLRATSNTFAAWRFSVSDYVYFFKRPRAAGQPQEPTEQ